MKTVWTNFNKQPDAHFPRVTWQLSDTIKYCLQPLSSISTNRKSNSTHLSQILAPDPVSSTSSSLSTHHSKSNFLPCSQQPNKGATKRTTNLHHITTLRAKKKNQNAKKIPNTQNIPVQKQQNKLFNNEISLTNANNHRFSSKTNYLHVCIMEWRREKRLYRGAYTVKAS